MGIGMSSHQTPWGASPYGQQGLGTNPLQSFGSPSLSQPFAQPLQQILQTLQTVPYQVQQLQQLGNGRDFVRDRRLMAPSTTFLQTAGT